MRVKIHQCMDDGSIANKDGMNLLALLEFYPYKK